jgi:hypothetical protein
MVAAKCDAIVTPNMGRADLPDLMPDEMPWATWLTYPRIPLVEKAGPKDTLLVADASWKTLAIDKGWKADRIFVAAWPPRECAPLFAESRLPGMFRMTTDPTLAIIADTQPLDPPARIVEYSSHRLLWEFIRDELLNDPFALGNSADAYLDARMRQLRIGDDGFDRHAFIDGIIFHARLQGLARLLIGERVPLKIFGCGWEMLEEFGESADGPIRSREQLNRAIDSAIALIHVWPKTGAHPIEAMGKPVIRPGLHREALIRDAKLAIKGKLGLAKVSPNRMSGSTILCALQC